MTTHPRVRIVDIADELGVSTATVSNVIHGKTKKISDRTVQEVQRKLEERQYIPHMAGLLLAQNDSRIIGVAVKDHEKYEGHAFEDPFLSASLNCLSDEIERAGRFMMLKKAKSVLEIVKFASMWNLDGMVVLSFCADEYQELRDQIHIPFVVYDGFFENRGRICNLTIDDRDGGRQVGAHFRENGYGKVLCIADNEICMDRERYLGFCEAFGNGAEFLKIPMWRADRLPFYEEHLQKLLEYDAVFAVSDFYAAELLHFLLEHDVSVPRDLAIAGFDDTPVCMQTIPTLTSVRQDSAYRAKVAVESLCRMKEDPDYTADLVCPVTLVARESTARL